MRSGWIRRRWVGVPVVAVSVVVAFGFAVLGWAPWQGAGRDDLPRAVREELSGRVARLLERTDADLGVLWGSGRRCTVDVLGTDPPAARRTADAHVVYVWAACSVVDSGTPGGWSGPVSVRLAPAVRAEVPGDGAGYGPGVRRIFPARLHDLILERLSPSDHRR